MEVIKRMDNSFQGDGIEVKPSVKSDIIPVETNKDGYLTKRSSIAELFQLKAMEGFVKDTVHQFGRTILDGNTDIKPYQLGKRSACDYCAYRSVCGFDVRLDGYNYRNLHSLSNEEVWYKIMEKQKALKEGRNTDGLDSGSTESN